MVEWPDDPKDCKHEYVCIEFTNNKQCKKCGQWS